MSFNFIEYKEKEDLKPIEVKNKEEYIHDLMEIEHSTSGRIDALILNTFILEAIRLVINSIFLFEKGYFDCAYYSLRQSLEVSTTMVYLIELEPGKRETELNNWKKQSKFPMYGEMLKFLKNARKNERLFL